MQLSGDEVHELLNTRRSAVLSALDAQLLMLELPSSHHVPVIVFSLQYPHSELAWHQAYPLSRLAYEELYRTFVANPPRSIPFMTGDPF